MTYSNIVTNYSLSTPASEFYTTVSIDEVIKFKDYLGEYHDLKTVRIDANGTDLLVQFVKYDDIGIAALSDIILINSSSFVNISEIEFGGIKILGAIGQKIKFYGMY